MPGVQCLCPPCWVPESGVKRQPLDLVSGHDGLAPESVNCCPLASLCGSRRASFYAPTPGSRSSLHCRELCWNRAVSEQRLAMSRKPLHQRALLRGGALPASAQKPVLQTWERGCGLHAGEGSLCLSPPPHLGLPPPDAPADLPESSSVPRSGDHFPWRKQLLPWMVEGGCSGPTALLSSLLESHLPQGQGRLVVLAPWAGPASPPAQGLFLSRGAWLSAL